MSRQLGFHWVAVRSVFAAFTWPDREDVEWLLKDLSSKLGYSMANRQPERFIALAQQGPEEFPDAVLLAEGLDPNLEK